MQPLTSAPFPPNDSPCIGVFDSGVGGLSVLRAIRLHRPEVALHYVADSGHAPYGDRDEAHVVQRSVAVADHLIRQGAQLVVVACNTATAWAIEAIRGRHPGLRIVGVEPGIKPAALHSRAHRIGVMATPATLASPRYAALVQRHAAHCEVIPVACHGLASAIERGHAADAEVDALLDRYCAPLLQGGADTVVLGCTHYPFVAERIAQRLGPGIDLLDTSEAVARHALSLWPLAASAAQEPGSIRLETTGQATTLERLAKLGLGRSLRAHIINL
jgi:glutamate racemase